MALRSVNVYVLRSLQISTRSVIPFVRVLRLRFALSRHRTCEVSLHLKISRLARIDGLRICACCYFEVSVCCFGCCIICATGEINKATNISFRHLEIEGAALKPHGIEFEFISIMCEFVSVCD